MKVCYISHPIKGKSTEEIAQLEARGVAHVKDTLEMEPLLPRTIDSWDHGENPCPQVMDAGEGADHDWACYMRADLIELLKCDAILMMPGWRTSRGAGVEHDLAQLVGIPVHYYGEVREN